MIELIITLALFWLAMLIVVYAHELGHGAKRIKIKFGIIPSGAAYESHQNGKLGGLAVNFLIAYAIFYFKPENILLQYIGLVSWMHFVFYVIFGSFNKEIKRKQLIIWNHKYKRAMQSFWKNHVFDDVPNELWYIFVPLGIIVFWWMKGYYLPILASIWNIILAAFGV
jgi:hypothetical protein